jgi:hypothetical protein
MAFEHADQIFRSGQAAGMRGEDAVGAAFHRLVSYATDRSQARPHQKLQGSHDLQMFAKEPAAGDHHRHALGSCASCCRAVRDMQLCAIAAWFGMTRQLARSGPPWLVVDL